MCRVGGQNFVSILFDCFLFFLSQLTFLGSALCCMLRRSQGVTSLVPINPEIEATAQAHQGRVRR